MAQYRDIFKGVRITQMGLGLLGRGIGDARFLAQAGAELIVTDKKTSEELSSSLQELSRFDAITFHLGAHSDLDFRDRDLVLKGAGVPLDSPYIQTARDAHVPVDMSASLVMRLARIPYVGVTGTRGKSTVTQLLYEIFTTAARNNRLVRGAVRAPLLGGNVRGVSNLALLDSITEHHMGVFELDSWQCQGLGEAASLNRPSVRQGPLSPNLAVFTSFMPDHMNYYRGSMERYFEDKAQIFLHQQKGDALVVGAQMLPFLEGYRSRIRGELIVADASHVPDSWELPLLGAHNRYNAGIAIAAARAWGVPETDIQEALASYQGLAGRLQVLPSVRGVRVVNDNNATTPDATVAALEAVDEKREGKVVLLLGGADKGLSLTKLLDAIHNHVKACVLLPGSGTDRLIEECAMPVPHQVETLEDGVALALSLAASGDTVLFSPAFASFGLFANEYERNDAFVAALRHHA